MQTDPINPNTHSGTTTHSLATHAGLANWLLRIGISAIAIAFVYVALVIPNRLSWISLWSFTNLPLEAILLCALLLLPGRAAIFVRSLAAVLLAAGIILKIADMSAYLIFARIFNPVLDTYLLSDGMGLLSSTFGQLGAVLFALALMLLATLILVCSYLALYRIQAIVQAHTKSAGISVLVALVFWTGMSISNWPRATTVFYDHLAMHVDYTRKSIAELREFREVVNQDSYANVPGDLLFGALEGKDVIVIFVESYGRTLVDSGNYASYIKPMLQQATEDLAESGFDSRSGFLTSPTVGGISWLAHGSVLSGMWIDSQIRYDSLMISERPSLVKLFQSAGWRTVGVMPAITMAWPEGQYYGYDKIYAAADLDYRGLPFNYVTMPDQFTMSRFQERERSSVTRKPVMAEIALITSHAPWTPVPTLIDWNSVGDGAPFIAQSMVGDPPEVVWQDKERVLRHYRESVAYVLDTLVSWINTFGDDELVVLIMGDHQPMPYVTEESENRDVLAHLITRDPQVLAAMSHWQWTPGMLPADDAPVWRMDEVRDRFIAAFSEPLE